MLKLFKTALLLLVAMVCLQSCSKKQDETSQPGITATPHVTSFAPLGGVTGLTVTINGTNFSASLTGNSVTFNGIAATVKIATATSLTVTVPPGAGSGKIAVRVGSATASSADDFMFVYTASTFAGSSYGFKDAADTNARFSEPYGLATDALGNVYIADSDNNRIRKITPTGVVSTIAGDGSRGTKNGAAASAQFNFPHGLVLDAAGNIYVADAGNNLIRKITAAGVVSTVAGDGTPGLVNGTGTASEFNFPADLVLDASGNLFVTDVNNKCIRKITPAGVVSAFTAAVFVVPDGLAIDASGNLYVADPAADVIRKVTTAGVVSTVAGDKFGFVDGFGTAVQFLVPEGVAIDAGGNLYVADLDNNAIRKITPAGLVSTIAGNGAPGVKDGAGPDARFNNPSGITVDALGNVYVGDMVNSRIRKLQ